MLGPFATATRRTPHCHSPGVVTVARRLRIDVHDNNDNAWQRGPIWPQRAQTYTELVPLKYIKLAAKYPRRYSDIFYSAVAAVTFLRQSTAAAAQFYDSRTHKTCLDMTGVSVMLRGLSYYDSYSNISTPGGAWSTAISLSVFCVCLSVCLSARKRTRPNFTKVSWRRCDTLSTSGFVDGVVFCIMVSTGQNQVTLCFEEVCQVAVPVGCRTTTVFGRVHRNAALGGKICYLRLRCWIAPDFV